CCANTWYAIGALRLRRGQPAEARAAFHQALDRLPVHPMARAGLAVLAAQEAAGPSSIASPRSSTPPSIEAAIARAAAAILIAGDPAVVGSVQAVDQTLGAAPAGNA